MNNKDQSLNWSDLHRIWLNSTQNRKIHLELSQLLEEIKKNTTQLEHDLIESDLATLKSNWVRYQGEVSSFESDSIKKDWAYISQAIRKFFNFFKRNS